MSEVKQPRDEDMRESDMQEAIDFWKKYHPDSAQEVWEFALQRGKEKGFKKGFIEGFTESIKKNKKQMTIEMARRLIEDDKSDTEIQRYIDLSSVDIRKLRYGVCENVSWVSTIA